MTANKHTPGPWSVEGVGIRALVRAGINGVIVAVRHRLPAGEHEANTRLIAAALELLENLIGCMEALASHAPDCIEVQCARAAIAKAGGAA